MFPTINWTGQALLKNPPRSQTNLKISPNTPIDHKYSQFPICVPKYPPFP